MVIDFKIVYVYNQWLQYEKKLVSVYVMCLPFPLVISLEMKLSADQGATHRATMLYIGIIILIIIMTWAA